LILKTYARVVTDKLEETIVHLEALTGSVVELQFTMGQVTIAAIGDFCVIAAPASIHAELRAVVGPIVVDDLSITKDALLRMGGTVTAEPFTAPTGQVMYMRHPDGIAYEYLQYSFESTQLVGLSM